MGIEPFRIAIDDEEWADLQRRIRATRWPDQIPGSGWAYGTDSEILRPLAEHWADGYDWRSHEALLNRYPQFTTRIQGEDVHFVHARSPHPDALPLILTHGWPGSFSEFTHLIGPLTDPEAHGGSADDAFHVVVPSLPGYGFSGPTRSAGWDVRRTGAAWAELMASLGYRRYGAQGGDWGSMVSRHLGDQDPDHVVGVHVNLMTTSAPGRDDDHDDLSEFEQRQRARMEEYFATGSGYAMIQGSKPQTLATALNDSPVGLLSWILEKFWAWTDHDGDPTDAVPARTSSPTCRSTGSPRPPGARLGCTTSRCARVRWSCRRCGASPSVSPTSRWRSSVPADAGWRRRTTSSTGPSSTGEGTSPRWRSRTSSSPTSVASSGTCDERGARRRARAAR